MLRAEAHAQAKDSSPLPRLDSAADLSLVDFQRFGPTPVDSAARRFGLLLQRLAVATYRRCVFPNIVAMPKYRRGAFPGGDPWQHFAVACSRAVNRGSFFASCVPERASDG